MRKARRPAAIAMALALALQLGTVVPAAAAGINSTAGYENGNSPLNLNLIARYASGQYNVDGGVMEIVAYSQSNGYAYAINGQSGLLAAIPLGDLTAGISVARLSGTDIDVKALVEAADSSFRYGDMTSVAISPDNTILAAALQAEGYHDAGRVALFTCGEDGSLTLQGLVEAGAQPDMVTFADNATALTAISQASEACCILLIPYFLKKFGIKGVMLMAMFSWVLRFGFFGIGNTGSGLIWLILSCIVYGVAFDFFNVAGGLFVDKQTDAKLRSSAQGLFMIMTNGIGASVGTFLAGTLVVNKHVDMSGLTSAAQNLQGWQESWFIFAAYALVISILFIFVFKDTEKSDVRKIKLDKAADMAGGDPEGMTEENKKY